MVRGTRHSGVRWWVAAWLLAAAAAGGEIDPLTIDDPTVDEARALVRTHPRSPGTGVGDLTTVGGRLELPGITRLEPAAATALAMHQGILALPGLVDPSAEVVGRLVGGNCTFVVLGIERLRPDVATAAASSGSTVAFTRLASLTPDAAAALAAKRRGTIVFGGLRRLSIESVRPLAAAPSRLQFPDATEVDVEAVGLLARRGSEGLRLPAVTAVDDKLAAACAEARGVVMLSGVRSLSPSAAIILGASPAVLLDLSGLETLPPEVAAGLAARGGRTLLDGVRELSPEAARKLVNRPEKRGSFSLGGLVAPTIAVIDALAEGGSRVTVGGCRELDDATAARLAGATVVLRSVAIERLDSVPLAKRLASQRRPQLPAVGSLTPEAAAALAECRGAVELPVVEELSDEVAEAFRGSVASLSLPGLRRISPRAAAALAARPGKGLSLGLSAVAADVAATLATCRGDLALPALASLEPATAAALATHEGKLVVACPDLTPAVAAGFAGRGGSLWLLRCPSIDAAAARALATGTGTLVLPDVATLSVAAASAFAAHEGRVTLAGLRTIEPAVAEVLLGGDRVAFDWRLVTRLTPAAAARVAARRSGVVLDGIEVLESADAVEVARILARKQGSLALPSLRRLSWDTLAALLEKPDVRLPPLDWLEFIPEPASGHEDDFGLPDAALERRPLPR
jgi:hypothetical protein